MSLIWNESARLEFIDAARYYAQIDIDLAERFLAAVEVASAGLSSNPRLQRQFEGEMRKVRVARFPYALIYQIKDGSIHVIAIMHLHREPGYWRERLD